MKRFARRNAQVGHGRGGLVSKLNCAKRTSLYRSCSLFVHSFFPVRFVRFHFNSVFRELRSARGGAYARVPIGLMLSSAFCAAFARSLGARHVRLIFFAAQLRSSKFEDTVPAFGISSHVAVRRRSFSVSFVARCVALRRHLILFLRRVAFCCKGAFI